MSTLRGDTYLNIEDAHLRVTGNVHANAFKLGLVEVVPGYSLASATNVGNTTSQTVQFTNTDTAFTTTGNVSVGKELTVTGNVEVGTANLFVDTQNGRVGVGTTEPSGQLELVGDSTTQEYPPGPMDDYETLIPGHGVFGLHHTPGSGASGAVVNAFNKSTAVGDSWYSSVQVWTPGGQNVAGPFNYTGTHSIAGISGEWVYITLPYHVNMEYLQITARNGDAANAPNSATIIGSSDGGTTWEQVGSWSDKTSSNFWLDGGIPSPNFTITSTKPLNAVGFVVTETNGWYAFTIGEIKFFGTPGPTTLDKGSLSLTRSLDVPRISRYDVDTETPRPEKLVVDFDTTVNSSPTDISGKGNHGTFSDASGAPTYSAVDKAFDFDGVNGAIYSGPLSPAMTGDRICSMSAWFKTTNASTVNQQIVWLGAYSVAGLLAVAVSNGTLRISIGFGCSLDVAGVIESNTWYHVVGIKQGTGSITSSNFSSTFKLYLNGEPMTGTFGGTARTLNVTTSYWYVGAGNSTGAEAFSGYISNPKLYDTVLEPSEVRKLYNLGRTGRSMVISDTAVGIGKVPEAQLDVRGAGRFQGLGVNTDNLIGALQVHQGPDITFGGTTQTIRDVVPGFVISSDSAKWAMFINSNDDFIFTSHNSLSGTYTGVTGYILEGAYDQRMNDFTGQHRCFLRGISREQIKDKVGLIVSSDKNKYTMISGDIVTGQNAIDISESIPDVSISQKAYDKACFGVISDVEDPEKREDLYGVFGTPFPKEKGDDRVYINSVGEGAIWVANTNGSLEAGDYITTSNVTGYGQKQDSAGLMNYTVAKITMDCDFNPETQPIQIIKRDETGENVLDEHGQIQWEDHPTETEKAYKIRYLDADGNITDEANHVYKAAFVGCTYHCG